MRFYFNSFFEPSTQDNYLKPNKNCNLTSWFSGCEPGWACSIGQDQPVDLENSRNIPARTHNCHACCEGFFCPHGITCMIRKYSSMLEFFLASNLHMSIENPSYANLTYLELLELGVLCSRCYICIDYLKPET